MNPRTPEISAYWLALGRFIHAFAELELEIKMVLAFYANTKKGQFQALWSGTRGDAALSLIRRIRLVTDAPLDPLFERWAHQFKVVNEARNLVVHLAPITTASGISISNASKVLPGKQVMTPMNPAELENLRQDVDTLRWGVVCTIQQIRRGRPARKEWIERASAPWRYTQPPRPQQDRNPK